MPGPIQPIQMLGAAKRAAEVAATLTRFGFGEVIRTAGLGQLLKGDPGEVESARNRPLPVRARLLLENLGPTFIKAGQILSTRADLLPPEWIAEFKKLQSEVPAAPWDDVKKVIEAEVEGGLDAFASIEEESLAAASMAQVHRATLKTGEQVVLKILRPGIRERMSADMELLGLFTRMTRSHLENIGFDPEAVVGEFKRQLERETDLLLEADSTQRMHRDFADEESVTFPKVYPELCTRSVLVLEEIHGTLLSKLDLSTLSDERRERIVRNGAGAVFRQCLVIGFFHADPHPGNIFVLDDDRVCFIDCGMTGLIDPGTMATLAQLTYGAVSGDLDRVAKAAVELAGADPNLVEDRKFRSEVYRFVDRFGGGSIESIRMGGLLEEFFGVLRRFHLRCPADIVYLIKALTTIEGVAQEIAPSFDLVAHVRPYVERLIFQRYGFRAMQKRIQSAMLEYGDLFEELPGEVRNVLQTIRRNQLSVRLEHAGIDKMTAEIERASMNISWSMGIAALIVGSAVLVLADSIDRSHSFLSLIASFGFVVAVVLALFRAFRSWRSK